MLNTIEFTKLEEEKPVPEWIGNDFILIDESGLHWIATFTRIDSDGYHFVAENERHPNLLNPIQWACLNYE